MDAACARAYTRWQRAAGPFWMYVCLTPLFGEAAAGVGARRLSRRRSLQLPPPSASPTPSMLMMDVPLTKTLPMTPALIQGGFYVLPVSQRWAARTAVLDSADMVRQLIAYAPGTRVAEPKGLVVLLDGERFGPQTASATPSPQAGSRFDNRYRYSSCRFPPAALLREHGVRAVRWVSDRGIAGDLSEYAERLAADGLEPEVFPAKAE